MNLRQGYVLQAAAAMFVVLGTSSGLQVRAAGQTGATPQPSVADGVYSAEQSGRGQRIYADTCASCHGADLSGGATLAGDVPSLAGVDFVGAWNGSTLGDLFERVRTMPPTSPGSLSAQQYADVLAFILSKNGFPAGQTDLTADAAALTAIRFEGSSAPVKTAPEPNRSVMDGVYEEEQSRRGQGVYADACASCHAAGLTGADVVPALVGQDFLNKWIGATAGELFERIRSTMPQASPGSLTPQQYADILAFIFNRNKFPAGRQALPDDSATLGMIRIETSKR
jgi:S-disulfanyl-L-cysteine oxidoreductase SoxD